MFKIKSFIHSFIFVVIMLITLFYIHFYSIHYLQSNVLNTNHKLIIESLCSTRIKVFFNYFLKNKIALQNHS